MVFVLCCTDVGDEVGLTFISWVRIELNVFCDAPLPVILAKRDPIAFVTSKSSRVCRRLSVGAAWPNESRKERSDRAIVKTVGNMMK